MAKNQEYGPHCPCCVSEGGGRIVKTNFTSAQQPNLNLKQNPNADVERAIKGLKFPTVGAWNAAFNVPSMPKG